jgi:hypothetical protein
MTPVHQLMLAVQPYIAEALKVDQVPDPTPRDVEAVEKQLQLLCTMLGIKSSDQAVLTLLDLSYGGHLPNIAPQFPREAAEDAITKVRCRHPDLWEAAAKQLGLAA